MKKSQFVRQEAVNRASFEYGIYPYEPPLPCKILSSSVEYRCDCGFRTSSAGAIFDHLCTPHQAPIQLMLF